VTGKGGRSYGNTDRESGHYHRRITWGIGRAIAERFAQDGATVVINYSRSANQAQDVAAITARGGQALALQADISRVPEIRRLFQETRERLGRIDILVNNAAGFVFKPIAETTEEEFDQVFALNTRGTFFAMQEAARVLPDRGRIINISSGGTAVGMPCLGVYLGSKSALEEFTLVLANELGPRGITVNTVSAGVTETQMLDDLFHFWPPEVETMIEQRTAMGRLGQPQEVADAVAFLATEDARWITGQNIRVDGGIR
jgi:3-oxoacyl-[acyl-carrier protein] reductase